MATQCLQNSLLAMAFLHCDADVTATQSDRLTMGELCLTAGMQNSAPATFEKCHGEGGAFWMDFQGHYINASQFFTIHVGKWSPSASNPHGFSKWCLEAVDLHSSSLTVLECNGSPQQYFKLSGAYNTSGAAYEGTISLPDGKCLEGTDAQAGDAPTAQICNGASWQIWGSCRSWRVSSPFHNEEGDNCDPDPPAPAPAPIGQQIQSMVSSLCLDLPGGATYNGALLWTWECSGDVNQQWSFQDGQLVYSADPSKCVDLLGGDTTNGNALGLWDCLHDDSGAPVESQHWGKDSDFDSRGTIYMASSAASDAAKCIRIGGKNVGDSVAIWDCTAEEEEIWRFDGEHSFAVV